MAGMLKKSHAVLYVNFHPCIMREVVTEDPDDGAFQIDQPNGLPPLIVTLPPCRDGMFAIVTQGANNLGTLWLVGDDVRVVDAGGADIDMFPLHAYSVVREDLVLKVVTETDARVPPPRVTAAMIGAAFLAHTHQAVPTQA